MTQRLIRGIAMIAVTLAACYALLFLIPFLVSVSGGMAPPGTMPLVAAVVFAAGVAIYLRAPIARAIASDAADVDGSAEAVAFIVVKIVGLLMLFSAVGDAALLLQSRWRAPQVTGFAITAILAFAFLAWTRPIARAVVEDHRAGKGGDARPSTMATVFAGVGLYELLTALPALARTLVSIPSMRGLGFGWNPAGDLTREIVQIALAVALILYSRAVARKVARP